MLITLMDGIEQVINRDIPNGCPTPTTAMPPTVPAVQSFRNFTTPLDGDNLAVVVARFGA